MVLGVMKMKKPPVCFDRRFFFMAEQNSGYAVAKKACSC